MKTIKVVFDVDMETIKTLIQSGENGKKTITEKEIEEMSKKGLINAADYLSTSEQKEVSGIIGKIVGKAVSKISSPKVQKTVVATVVEIVSSKQSPKIPTGPLK